MQSAPIEYTPRHPEQSVLYQVVAEQLETFLARQQAPPDTTAKILECLGLPSRAPPLAPAVSDFHWQMDSF